MNVDWEQILVKMARKRENDPSKLGNIKCLFFSSPSISPKTNQMTVCSHTEVNKGKVNLSSAVTELVDSYVGSFLRSSRIKNDISLSVLTLILSVTLRRVFLMPIITLGNVELLSLLCRR